MKNNPDLAEQLQTTLSNLEYNQIQLYSPYPKQLEFLNAGASHQYRSAICGNQVGKTLTATSEVSYHLTGRYPKWWKGKRFSTPTTWYVASIDNKDTRNILQKEYLGTATLSSEELGTGTIPKDCILNFTRAQGITGLADIVEIRHASGGVSKLMFRSYQEGRDGFQGVKLDGFHFDEEPPKDVLEEAIMRTFTRGGIGLITLTPLEGVTDTYMMLTDPESSFWTTGWGWYDCPHITEEKIEYFKTIYSPTEFETRATGKPSVGKGRIYPFKDEEISIEPFTLPDSWLYCYGMDFGWTATALVFMAIDPNTDVMYIYDCYCEGSEVGNKIGLDPRQHYANLIDREVTSLEGAGDPTADRVTSADGEKVMQTYKDLGFRLHKADNTVASGITEVYTRFRTGKLKIFSHLTPLFDEISLYHRDKNQKVVKKNDHLVDALRYAVVTGPEIARKKTGFKHKVRENVRRTRSWLTV